MANFTQHYAYDKFRKLNDIGLIKILNEFNFTNPAIQPIKLPELDRNYDNLLVTGWGRTQVKDVLIIDRISIL